MSFLRSQEISSFSHDLYDYEIAHNRGNLTVSSHLSETNMQSPQLRAEYVVEKSKRMKPKPVIVNENLRLLESLLMQNELIENNFNTIVSLIDQLSSYELINYRAEESNLTFIHLVLNRSQVHSTANERFQLEIIMRLLDKQCDLNQVDTYGFTSLHYICNFNLIEIARSLLKANHLSNQSIASARSVKHLKLDKIHFIPGTTPLQVCCWLNHLKLAKLLVQHFKINVNEKNDAGFSALHICFRQGHYDFAKYLIENGANVNEVDLDKNTPLHICARYGNICLARLLLDSSANILVVNEHGQNALHVAVLNQNYDIAKILLESGIEVNQVDHSLNSPLHACAMLPEVVGNGRVNYGSNENNSETKSVRMATLLMSYCCNPFLQNSMGQTALHIAAKNNGLSLVNLLVTFSHSLLNISDYFGQTSLYLACKWESYETERYLLSKGANKDSADLAGMMPVHLSTVQSSRNVLAALLEFGDDINKATLKHPADTPLHLAVKYENIKTVEYLIEKDCNVDKMNAVMQTPLHAAILNGSLSCVKALVAAGANVNKEDESGQSPLHLSVLAQKNSSKIARILIDNDARINKEDPKKVSSLALAVMRGNLEMVKLLTNKRAKVMNSNYESVAHICAKFDLCDTECLKVLIGIHGVNTLFNYSYTSYCTPFQLCVEKKASKFFRTVLACEQVSCLELFERLNSVQGFGVSPMVMAITSHYYEFITNLIEFWKHNLSERHHNYHDFKHGCDKCHKKDICLFKPNWNNPEQNVERFDLNVLIRENEDLALEILDTFMHKDVVNFQTHLYLDHLEPCETFNENLVYKYERPLTPLETIYVYNKTRMLTHPVVRELINQKYYEFTRIHYLIDSAHGIFLLATWTAFAFYEDYSRRHNYQDYDVGLKVVILSLAFFTFSWELVSKLLEFYFSFKRLQGYANYIKFKYHILKSSEKYGNRSRNSIVHHLKESEERYELEHMNRRRMVVVPAENEINVNANNNRLSSDETLKKIIKEDCFVLNNSKTNKYSLIENENRASKSLPLQYKTWDFWTSWFVCLLQFTCLSLHVIDIFIHTDTIAQVTMMLIYVILIIIWLKKIISLSLNCFGMSQMHTLRLIIPAISSFILFYFLVYFLFSVVFWRVIAGILVSQALPTSDNSSSATFSYANQTYSDTVPIPILSGFQDFISTLLNLYKMLFDYQVPYEKTTRIQAEQIIIQILCLLFRTISYAVILNLVISLVKQVMSDSSTWSPASAEAYKTMKLLGFIMNIEWRLNKSDRLKFLNKIKFECSPLIRPNEMHQFNMKHHFDSMLSGTNDHSGHYKRIHLDSNMGHNNKWVDNNLKQVLNDLDDVKKVVNEIKELAKASTRRSSINC